LNLILERVQYLISRCQLGESEGMISGLTMTNIPRCIAHSYWRWIAYSL